MALFDSSGGFFISAANLKNDVFAVLGVFVGVVAYILAVSAVHSDVFEKHHRRTVLLRTLSWKQKRQHWSNISGKTIRITALAVAFVIRVTSFIR